VGIAFDLVDRLSDDDTSNRASAAASSRVAWLLDIILSLDVCFFQNVYKCKQRDEKVSQRANVFGECGRFQRWC
jgi:hypothetical protein